LRPQAINASHFVNHRVIFNNDRVGGLPLLVWKTSFLGEGLSVLIILQGACQNVVIINL
jgi:hypothetical protein